MAFLSKFFSRGNQTPLPTLEELLRAKGMDLDVPGLENHAPEFEHLSADERQTWVDAIVTLHSRNLPLPPLWLDAQYDLIPQLVPTWLAEREALLFRPFVEGLSQRVLACGQVMPSEWLTIWGVDEKDVLDRSLDQLRELSKEAQPQRLPSGIYQCQYKDGLNAARLLLPELWCDLFPGQNTFVAVPSGQELYIAPQVLLPKLVEAITQSVNNPKASRLMATIYQRVDGNLLPATLQDPHPIAQPQREMRLSDLQEGYRAQEASLDPSQGVPGPVGLLRTQQGRAVGFTIWTEGTPVLLPEMDLVGFVNAKGKPLGLYSRQTLPRIYEIRGTTVDLWGPRRLRYEGFPTKEQLERLECFASAEQMEAIFKNSQSSPAPRAVTGTSAQAPSPLSQAASPVPPHLRGQSLGVQNED